MEKLNNIDKLESTYELSKDEKLKMYSNNTFEDAIEKLSIYGMCNMVRPTGFGKSYNLARITSYKMGNGEYKYNKCLYLYPLDVIRMDVENKYGENGTSDVKLHNTDFRSYVWLNNRRKDGTLLAELKKYNLIMCDECHLCGSDGFIACYEEFKELLGVDKIHIIGVTASPNRMDSFDVINELFGGRKCAVFELTAQTLYEEGIMIPPLWYVGISDKKEYVENTCKHIVDQYNITAKEANKRIGHIEGGDIIIKEGLEEHKKGQKYYKFICFYTDKNDLLNRYEMVADWFDKIFEKRKINKKIDNKIEKIPMKVRNSIIVSTRFDEEETVNNKSNSIKICNIKDIAKLVEEDGIIDLIHCIDMLNMGYHVDDIDGIIMLRNTKSEIIQTQQIGRCQSITSKKQPLIFDLANNYFTKKWFKCDSNCRESEYNLGSAVIDGKFARLYTNDGIQVTMTKAYLANIQFIEELKAAERLKHGIETSKLVFWYKELNAPMYVLMAKNTDKSMNDIIEQLKDNGVYIEDELDYARSLDDKDKKLVARSIQNAFKGKKSIDEIKKMQIFYEEKE